MEIYIKVILKIIREKGKGIYKDNNNDILQNRKGKFTYDSKVISYEGNFRNGNFFGFRKITYINKVELETIFLNNKEYNENYNFKGNTFINHNK